MSEVLHYYTIALFIQFNVNEKEPKLTMKIKNRVWIILMLHIDEQVFLLLAIQCIIIKTDFSICTPRTCLWNGHVWSASCHD